MLARQLGIWPLQQHTELEGFRVKVMGKKLVRRASTVQESDIFVGSIVLCCSVVQLSKSSKTANGMI